MDPGALPPFLPVGRLASIKYQNGPPGSNSPTTAFLTTVDDDSNTTERYIPSLNEWIADANTTVNLWDASQP